MKKWVIALVAFLLLALIVLGTFLLMKLLLPSSSEADLNSKEVEAYAREHWPQYSPVFDKKSQTLTLSKETILSYDEACKIGGSVYSGSTSPQSYLDAVYAIKTDLAAHFGSGLRVELSFLSTDGEPVFNVSDDGTIETCWE